METEFVQDSRVLRTISFYLANVDRSVIDQKKERSKDDPKGKP